MGCASEEDVEGRQTYSITYSRTFHFIYSLAGVFYMVVGGFYDDNYDYYDTEFTTPTSSYLDEVELISLDPDNPVPSCLTSLSNIPVGLYGAAGSVGDGKVT